jgi:hypothetical protein
MCPRGAIYLPTDCYVAWPGLRVICLRGTTYLPTDCYVSWPGLRVISVLVSSAVDREFNPRSEQRLYYCYYCFTVNQAELKSKMLFGHDSG